MATALAEDMGVQTGTRNIGILGTGNFARALAKRLFYSGYDVTFGSRRPADKQLSSIDECFCDMKLVSYEECIKSCSVIFVAVHAENYKDSLAPYADWLRNKILVEVSNRDRPSKTHSNAEYLSSLVPCARIVKGFNTVSAYSIENDYINASRQIFIAGDDANARLIVSNIARDLNYFPLDFGCLRAARRIEAHPLRLFPDWRGPIGFAVGVFNVWLLFCIYIYFMEKTAYRWDQVFVKVLNKPLCMTAITTLSATYAASSVATIFQIYYGTKHIRFPRWLDKWLRTRKQLGLVSFILIFVHVIFSLLIMSPTYLSSWYQPVAIQIPNNLSEPLRLPMTSWMIWKGEAACLAGTIAFLLLCFIAFSTLPSVANSMNWREWRFVQSKLGHAALLLAVVHVLVMGIPGWMKAPTKVYKSITFLSSLLPWVTLLLKVALSLPCVDRYVEKIRKGWERNPKHCKGKCSFQKVKDGYVSVQVEKVSMEDSSCQCSDSVAVPMISLEEEKHSDCACGSPREI